MSGSCELSSVGSDSEEKPDGAPDLSRLEGGGCRLTVAEGVTEWLDSILNSLIDDDDPSSSSVIINDAFVAVLFVLMYECGYTVATRQLEEDDRYRHYDRYGFNIKHVKRCVEDFKTISLKMDESYNLDFVLSGVDRVVKLIAIPIGDAMIVDLLAPGLRVIGTSYRIGDYLSKTPEGRLELSRSRQLSNTFKDAARSVCGVTLLAHKLHPRFHITSLPYEVLLNICSWLRPPAFTSFVATCKQFYNTLYDDEMIWKRYTRKYYNVKDARKEPSWKGYFLTRKRLDMKVKAYVWTLYQNSGFCELSPYSVDGVIML